MEAASPVRYAARVGHLPGAGAGNQGTPGIGNRQVCWREDPGAGRSFPE